MIRYLLAPALLCALAACGTTPPPPVVPDEPMIAPPTTVTIDPAAIAPCQPFTLLDPTKVYDQQDTLNAISVWKGEYDDCSKRFASFVVETSKALNINQVSPSK
jgi:hypothetical protein